MFKLRKKDPEFSLEGEKSPAEIIIALADTLKMPARKILDHLPLLEHYEGNVIFEKTRSGRGYFVLYPVGEWKTVSDAPWHYVIGLNDKSFHFNIPEISRTPSLATSRARIQSVLDPTSRKEIPAQSFDVPLTVKDALNQLIDKLGVENRELVNKMPNFAAHRGEVRFVLSATEMHKIYVIPHTFESADDTRWLYAIDLNSGEIEKGGDVLEYPREAQPEKRY